MDLAQVFGETSGLMKAISRENQQNALLQLMVNEALSTSQIEGEYLSRQDVMSSIKKHLGFKTPNVFVKDVRARGIAQLIIETHKQFNEPLSNELIRNWHALLFENNKHIKVGNWRTGNEPMQIISGAFGKEIVHFQAPPSDQVPKEMEQFISWYNNYHTNGNIIQVIIKSAITHLYFETIHPFEDGNGRIGRALAEKSLSQELGHPVALSLSTIIEKNKTEYYQSLKTAQRTLNITDWILYFGNLILNAQKAAQSLIELVIKKAKYYEQFQEQLNERQIKVINKMWDAGAEGFEGGMSAKKYISITQTSKATATRDLQHLEEIGALVQLGSGRSVHYELPFKIKS